MTYLLDTSVCIGLLRKSATQTAARVLHAHPQDFTICSIVLFELLYGAVCSDRREAEIEKVAKFSEHFECLDFDSKCAAAAGNIRTKLEKKGQSIGPYDILIAGPAIRHNLTLVTGNLAEFRRVEGLRVENWEQ
jgi:tRNA(fMet)-specific endonuclease VapC